MKLSSQGPFRLWVYKSFSPIKLLYSNFTLIHWQMCRGKGTAQCSLKVWLFCVWFIALVLNGLNYGSTLRNGSIISEQRIAKCQKRGSCIQILSTVPAFRPWVFWATSEDSGISTLWRDLTQDFPIAKYCQPFPPYSAIRPRHKQRWALKWTLERSCFIRTGSP
jgi:hypothetical protein